MNIDEAIKIKELEGDEFLRTDPDKIDEADRLSIEALKLIQKDRHSAIPWFRDLLPGETKE